MESYIAIDIGASSGRHMLVTLEGDQLRLQEVYRFENQAVQRGGHLYWDVEALSGHVIEGLRLAGQTGVRPVSVGIDTWGVDYVLVDAQGNRVGEAYAYRDTRTAGLPEALDERMGDQALYQRTGIQSQTFNTIYQMMADLRDRQGDLDRADQALLMPSHLMQRLCGVGRNEYTDASTSGLINADSKDWDSQLIEALSLPGRLLRTPAPPGTVLGPLLPQVAKTVGFQTQVVLPPSHDTAAAVLAAPLTKGSIFLSSGTWSLLGVERDRVDVRPESRLAGFSNEGGYGGTIRFLKNIMGLWMIQSLRREEAKGRPFGELIELAKSAADFPSRVDVNDAGFMAPESMGQALAAFCRRTGQIAPENLAERLACVYGSLALSYAKAVRDLEGLLGETFTQINIVGGGCQDAYLNQLTANACRMPVVAGPVEATALGNALCQMIASGRLASVQQARRMVADSFAVATFQPE